ncbi:VCBS repeat-containing protein [Streptomyces sp. S.PNR 29]|uniref:FG-GAP repeat domain-containing protein n=1 Tax=Streptomyces sp. S.PNR 29 TaxID=2973805 RepID=UPI0025B0C7BD|nr:VCBS repeat-containing protein [Streptomyces sp. S.PNR 29]MDN0200448.1 VCBS repeat-containing protein [Streptomyces sp. S.PNR 29]
MGRSALPRRRAVAAAFVTTSLVLTGAAALPATPAVAATALPPWTSPVTLTSEKTDVQEVVVTPDGTAVAVWNQLTATDYTRYLYAATRPSGSDTWSAPVLLATTPTEDSEVRVVARADGSVTALWTEHPNQPSPFSGTNETRVVASVLPAGQASAWSEPVEVVGVAQKLDITQLDLAEGPGGLLGATWRARPLASRTGEAYATTLSGDGGWATPVKVSNAAAYGGDALSPQIAFDAHGGTVVAYRMVDGNSTVMTTAKPAGADAWQTPAKLTQPTPGTGAPTLASGPYGTVHLVWEDPSGNLQTVRRNDAASDWSTPQTAATGVDDPSEPPEPLIGPDGDITLVWVDWTTNSSVRTTTFDESTGAWSAPQTLSTAYVPEQYDVSIARDGSVHALWTQSTADQQSRRLMEATLTDGSWSAARQVGNVQEAVHGEIAASSAGAATAVWSRTWSDNSTRLEASRTAWPALKVISQSVPASANLKGSTNTSAVWQPTWTTNTAVSSWTLTLTDPAGRTLRTLTGAPGGTSIAPSWNGRTSSGAFAPNGRLTWTLKAVHAGTGATSTLATGQLTVTGGAAVVRDFGSAAGSPDGIGDLLTLNSSGTLTFQYGEIPNGDFYGKKSGSGWSTSIKAVPFGDLSGDRCNDLLIRVGDALRRYTPGCGAAPTTSTAYKTISSTGWKQYDVLTSPGDVTKDGRPDLIARNASTGAVYLYKGTSTGTLSARVKLYDNWKTYKKVVGVGDLNGDGIGDLIAQDTANNLYRYLGTGSGTFKSRVKLFGSWGGSYNAVVGVGDLTGDGKADIVSRDSAGYLYRNNGDGKGSFGARTRISAGYGGYKGLF